MPFDWVLYSQRLNAAMLLMRCNPLRFEIQGECTWGDSRRSRRILGWEHYDWVIRVSRCWKTVIEEIQAMASFGGIGRRRWLFRLRFRVSSLRNQWFRRRLRNLPCWHVAWASPWLWLRKRKYSWLAVAIWWVEAAGSDRWVQTNWSIRRSWECRAGTARI